MVIGTAKAMVLPLPVRARPSTSRPARASGRAAVWMANGAVTPVARRAATIGSGTPSSAKEASRGSAAACVVGVIGGVPFGGVWPWMLRLHAHRAGTEGRSLRPHFRPRRPRIGPPLRASYPISAGSRPGHVLLFDRQTLQELSFALLVLVEADLFVLVAPVHLGDEIQQHGRFFGAGGCRRVDLGYLGLVALAAVTLRLRLRLLVPLPLQLPERRSQIGRA